MYGYISGEIKDVEPNYVILDNNGIGYLIYVPNPYGFVVGRNYTIYTYTKVAEDEYSLYGFKTKEEKELFLKLISVKGLGPKMALPMLATGSITMIEEAIEKHDHVKKCCVIGIPHKYKIQVPKAFIVLEENKKPNAKLKKELRDLCKKNLAAYAIPKDLEFVESLPKTLYNKIDYKLLEKKEKEKYELNNK